MNLREKIWYNPLYKIAFYFILLFVWRYIRTFNDPDFLEIVIESSLFALVVTVLYLSILRKVPIYIKKGFSDQLRDALLSDGARKIKEKNQITVFKLKNNIWPMNLARIIETDHYVILEVPENLHASYLKWITDLKIGFYDKK